MKLTENLITFERGESLLMLNGLSVRPVVINRGKAHIMRQLRDVDSITDRELLDFLAFHDIIVEEEPAGTGCNKCGAPHGSDSKTAGLSAYFLVAQSCNLSCRYCLNGDRTYSRANRMLMDEKTAYAAVDRLASTIVPGGNFDIVFFGGEPLLNWPLIKKVILYCENNTKKALPDLRIRYSITSNLTLLDSEMIEWAKRHDIGFLCDIDGPPEIHDSIRPFRNGKGSHSRTAAAVEKLNNAGISVSLRATVTSHNMRHIVEVAKHHKELGGSGSAFVTLNAVNSDEDIVTPALFPDPKIVAGGLRELNASGLWEPENLFPLNEYLSRLKSGARNVWACGAPFGNTPVIDVKGDVFACIYLVGIPRYRIGNVFSDAPYPDPAVVSAMLETINIDNSAECAECNLRYICGGGCPVGRFTIAGNPKADTTTTTYTQEIACTVNKLMIEDALWHYAAQIRENGI